MKTIVSLLEGMFMLQKTCQITEEQNKFLDDNAINFNKFVRNAIEKAMEEKSNASKAK